MDFMENISIVDAHIHLWDLQKLNYPWLKNFPKINRSFLLNNYFKASKGIEVEKMVFVQAECIPSQFMDEVKWIQDLADKNKKLCGIVPWAPIHSGNNVANILEEFKKDQRIKGVRQLIEPEKNTDFCLHPKFVEGVQLLGAYGFHFELTIGPEHFPSVIKLVERCPDTRFILDHIGNPNILKKQLEPWKSHLKQFADSGPHYCKFSNLVCNAELDIWDIEDLRPYTEAVIEIFGPDRLIWGSDWPHALRAASWSKWFQSAIILTNGLSHKDRLAIFRNNAIHFYKL